ncbi:MAG TPA: hypothetical protein PLY70_14220 [Saprospiraceae bacterium]|nr:hypothetical protein [Saprospiraceae bacterium]HPJ16662.1 hypothetical protein [Candidatus Woesebacteria bacterium]
MSEKIKPSFEKKVTYNLARFLLKIHEKQIDATEDYLWNDGCDGVFSSEGWFNNILNNYCNQEDLERFVAHGITKGDDDTKLFALLSILHTGHIKGDCAKIRKSGYIDAYTNGAFTLISPIDENLWKENKLNVGVIVAAPRFVPLIPFFKSFFPSFKLIEASDFPAWIENQKEKSQIKES